MSYKVLILGASYGSLFGIKLIAAGHDATLVCRAETAALINEKGTEVRIQLRGEGKHRSFFSGSLNGKMNALTPEAVRPEDYDLVCLAMQEPQYSHPDLKALLSRIARGRIPCMSIMNMPPLPYLKRIPSLDCAGLLDAFSDAAIWDQFDPKLMTLCSPDPQAFRPPEEAPNVLHVGLPTNFKVSRFHDPKLDAMLDDLERDIDGFRIDGKDVPVKLRVFDSLFVPFAKWSMLATGNYRCITSGCPRSIQEAVHGDIEKSETIYDYVRDLVMRLGADEADMVPFQKYADAARNLLKPSSAARAVYSGATKIERVDKLIKLVGDAVGMRHPAIDEAVQIIDAKLAENRKAVG